jgi:Flp pilus assembly protein TadG
MMSQGFASVIVSAGRGTPSCSERRSGRIVRLLKGDEASNLVEYALIFIFSMLLIMGIMDFGRTLFVYHFVSNAARDASRWASVNGQTCSLDQTCNGTNGMSNGPASPDAIANYVTTITPSGLSTSSPPLTTTVSWPVQTTSPPACSTTPNAPGCTVEVQVSYTFNFLFPLVRSSPLTLSSTSEVVIAH